MSKFDFAPEIRIDTAVPMSLTTHNQTTNPVVWLEVHSNYGNPKVVISQDDARRIAAILTYFADIGELPSSFEACQP